MRLVNCSFLIYKIFKNYFRLQLSKKVEAIALQRKITAKIVAAAGGKDSSKSEKLNVLKDLLQQLKKCHV